MRLVNLKDDLSPEQLKKTLEVLIERVIKNMYPEGSSEREALLHKKAEIAENIQEGLKDKTFTLGDLNEKTFANKLAATLISAVLVAKNDKLMDGLDKLRFDMEDKKLLEPKNLKDLLSSDEFKELAKAQFDCRKEMNQVLKMKPGEPKQAKEEEKGMKEEQEAAPDKKEPMAKAEEPQQDNVASNMFGLISTYTTGGLAAVVTYFMGNSAGFVDQHAGDGYSQIDEGNKVDYSQGDPTGDETKTLMNYAEQNGALLQFLNEPGNDKDLASGMESTLNRSTYKLTPGGNIGS